MQDVLYLGNLDAKRDWGHAKDYVEMQWLMLQQEKPNDYCISSGEYHTVREFVELAWSYLGKKIKWKGHGVNEKGFDEESGDIIVEVDSNYFRPSEVDTLLGDSSKAAKDLGWKAKIGFEEMVHEMMENDLKIAKRDKLVQKQGYKFLNAVDD